MLTTPSKKQFMTTFRTVSPMKMSLLASSKEANIQTSKVVRLMEIQKGGPENMGCTEKDIRNYEQKLKQEDKAFDAELLLEHCKETKEMNPSFYYDYEVDEENKLKHVFWADGLARKAYHDFGDVVVFDTTYETNQYSSMFCPFTGMNHHRQSINFGAAFIKDEKEVTFSWLFDKFLDAMSGRAPAIIVTDQDPAMKLAISKKFPRTAHRLCMWHITMKFSERLGAIARDKKFKEPMDKCIWASETPTEFELQWNEIMNNCALHNNKWLSHLFDIREHWIPAYFKDLFLGGIRSTQRGESMNSYFDHYVSKKNSLMEFMIRFERALKRLRNNENKADYEANTVKPKLMFNTKIEKQMAAIYTKENFSVFQNELSGTIECGVKLSKQVGFVSTYIVKDNKIREVVYDATKRIANCSCKLLESEGIPCRHILIVLRNEDIVLLPEYFILKRWTKIAAMDPAFDKNDIQLRADKYVEPNGSIGELSSIFSDCVMKARLVSNEALLHLKDTLLTFQKELDESLKNVDSDTSQLRSKRNVETIFVHPPNISKTKGSGKRHKGGKEKDWKSKRRAKGTVEDATSSSLMTNGLVQSSKN